MINPSASGWIDKFFSEQRGVETAATDLDFYLGVRETGFIYGHVVSVKAHKPLMTKGWMVDELAKVALLNTLFGLYRRLVPDFHQAQFVKTAIAFYNEMSPGGFNLLRMVFPSSPSLALEDIMDSRIKTNHNLLSKNFSHILTNALLFTDVLAFAQYLNRGSIPEKYLKQMEESLVSVVALALKTKTSKSLHDDLLIKLFEASVRYSKFQAVAHTDPEHLKLDIFTTDLEKFYLIDLAGMALWSDGKVEAQEEFFLYKIAEILGVPDYFVAASIRQTDAFILKYRQEIPYFNYSNPVRHFYDHLTQNVVTLIKRNRTRLATEIGKNKQLMVLLAQSTTRDLDPREKKKVKNQLVDICKTIPSLTIFLLPGGSLLLPILIKFIPSLLPSAFNENLSREND